MMTMQLTLEFRENVKRGLSESQMLNSEHGRGGFKKYHPRRCAEIIMAAVSADQWTGYIDLADLTQMHPWLISRMFKLLVKWKKLERTELYFIQQSGLTPVDRTQHPGYGKNYHGFEWGYRKITADRDLIQSREQP